MNRPIVDPLSSQTRDGQPFEVREATLDDAAELLDYIGRYISEPDVHTPLSPGELPPTIEQETQFIKSRQRENGLLIVAVCQDEIVGVADMVGSANARTRHSVMLGISVARAWRGRGVGGVMMQTLIDWAARHPYVDRVELEVFAANEGAIRLYQRLGFQEEGRKRRSYYWHEEENDGLIMGLLLPSKRQ